MTNGNSGYQFESVYIIGQIAQLEGPSPASTSLTRGIKHINFVDLTLSFSRTCKHHVRVTEI